MRILFLLNAFEPDGPGRLVLDLARRLNARDAFACQAAAMSRGGALRETFEQAGVVTHVLGGGWGSLGQLSALLKSHRFDVLHTSLLRADIAGRWIGARCGVGAIVSTEHGIHTWEVCGRALRPLIGALYRRTARDARAIIAVSQFVHDALVAEGLPAARVRLIRNGVDAGHFHPLSPEEKAAARREFGLDPGAVLVVAAGKMVALKNHRLLCEAMAVLGRSHPEIHCAIAGDGPLRGDLARFIRDEDLGTRVSLAGSLAGEAMPRFFGCADMLVQPSRMESFGLAVAEAMACGVPPIATRVGGMPELVTDGMNGHLVAPDDPRAMAQAIVSLAADSQARARMGQAARIYAREDLNVESMVEAYADLLLGLNPS